MTKGKRRRTGLACFEHSCVRRVYSSEGLQLSALLRDTLATTEGEKDA
jgi:hypothetical protein